MPVAKWTVVVNRSPEEVFAYLSDFSKHADWSPTQLEVTPTSEGPTRVGSTFHTIGFLPPRDKHHENDVEVTALDPPRRLAFTAHDRGQEFKSAFTLTSVGGQTQVERVLDMPKPPGFAGVIFPLIQAMVVKPGVQKGMNLLKAKLEGGAT